MRCSRKHNRCASYQVVSTTSAGSYQLCFHNLAGLVTTTLQTGVRRCRHCSADPRPRTSCCILVVDSSQPICAGSYNAISKHLCEHLHCSALMGGRQDQSQRSCGPPPTPAHHQGPPARPWRRQSRIGRGSPLRGCPILHHPPQARSGTPSS